MNRLREELGQAPKSKKYTGREGVRGPLDLAQAQKLLKASEKGRWYAYIVLSLLSGLRTEEVRALAIKPHLRS